MASRLTLSTSPSATFRSTFAENLLDKVKSCWPISQHLNSAISPINLPCTCPICPALRDEIGEWDSILEPRDTQKIIEALNAIDKGATEFTKACANAGIKPVQCIFWKNLPYVDIYRSIMPDILHQLYQGLLKHLVGWIRAVCGDAEIDAWCRRLPPNHHI